MPEDQEYVSDVEIALRAALNVLRDSVESGRMPSGLPLAPDAAALHKQAIARLGELLVIAARW